MCSFSCKMKEYLGKKQKNLNKTSKISLYFTR